MGWGGWGEIGGEHCSIPVYNIISVIVLLRGAVCFSPPRSVIFPACTLLILRELSKKQQSAGFNELRLAANTIQGRTADWLGRSPKGSYNSALLNFVARKMAATSSAFNSLPYGNLLRCLLEAIRNG